ncbi:MAG: TonB-dependent receptor [Acidobacteria bacterium]|nr:TonB-dependent receptor [Acidobacteriota bacterium]
MMKRLAVLAAALALAAPVYAQQPSQQPPPDPQDEDQPISFETQVVVTASRSEQQLVNAPAAVTLIGAQTIANSPATNIGDLLRSVPGINVMQTSARDINITTRGATSTLSTSQLALVDGRSVYLDFFGMVMWDLVPTSSQEIRQIEVIRGPASAVWGANAMTGVINVITKSPRELAAGRPTTLTIGVGAFERDIAGTGTDRGSLFSVNGSHAHAVNDRWAYKVSAGYFTQDPLPRPVGTIQNAFKTPYPPLTNQGTSQPKFDARVDYDMTGGGTMTFSGGVAGTEGLIHTGIGPFNVSSESRMSYVDARYQKAGRRVAFFTNLLDGNASNLLARGPTGQPLPLVFDTRTFDVEASDTRTFAARHVLTFGGNYRRNTFDISLAPVGDDRNEGGGFIQDEMFLGTHFRWVVGGRLDKFSSINDAVFSPRTTFMVKPDAAQSFRVSFNRAFRAPSFINNHIDTTILNEINLGAISPLLARYIFPIRAEGNPNLKQETMTAYEVGYSGLIRRRATVTAAFYYNVTDDGIYFTPNRFYTPAGPPPGLSPLIVGILGSLNPPVLLPSRFTYLNLGTIADKGVELGVDAALNRYVNVFTNYSHQVKPVAKNLPAGTTIFDVNWPPKNRFNAGFDFSYTRFLGNMSVNMTDEAYWQDVLDARYAGTTDAFTLVNAGFGVRWAGERVVTSVKVTNLTNEAIMQHIFGDVLKRQVVGEVRVSF